MKLLKNSYLRIGTRVVVVETKEVGNELVESVRKRSRKDVEELENIEKNVEKGELGDTIKNIHFI